MANGSSSCSNGFCIDRETQLRLAQLREELLTNFNALLVDRIRFLEQTISQLTDSSIVSSLPTPLTTTKDNETSRKTLEPSRFLSARPDRLSTASSSLLLRRSSSTTGSFLPTPLDVNLPECCAGARSCPSSVDLSTHEERRARFFSSKKSSRNGNRTFSDSSSQQLVQPIDGDSTLMNCVNSEKGRLETRRFACDVDDNDVRALKAMIYMEQARKQNARPLNRLRQALGISTNAAATTQTTSFVAKKTSNS